MWVCGCAGEGRVKGDNYRVCDVHVLGSTICEGVMCE